MRLLLLVSVFAVAVPDRQDPNVKDAKPLREQLLGEWRLTKRVINGNMDANPGDLRMHFTADVMQHILNNGSQPASKFTYTLDTTKTPATILFGKNETAIFKIEADVLTICLGQRGTYPPDFVSPPNSATTLVQLTRIKK
jgi:uncharacterized protein (TIGR03067 family)